MPSAVDLLRGGRYAYEPTYRGEEFPPQQMGQPTMPSQAAETAPPQERPSYASLLAESQAPAPQQQAPMSQPPARVMSPQGAMPQAAQPQQEQEPAWMTPRRKKMYEKAKQAYGAYQSAVDQRRKMRKQSREYSSLYNQMKNEQGKADQLEHMMTNYKDIFRPEDPRTMQAIRQQMQHFETAERLRGDLQKRLQKSGIKLPQGADVPEDPWGDAGDEQFDQFIREGYNDALLYDSNR